DVLWRDDREVAETRVAIEAERVVGRGAKELLVVRALVRAVAVVAGDELERVLGVRRARVIHPRLHAGARVVVSRAEAAAPVAPGCVRVAREVRGIEKSSLGPEGRKRFASRCDSEELRGRK